jgi:hypothetical protein
MRAETLGKWDVSSDSWHGTRARLKGGDNLALFVDEKTE